MNSIPTFLDSVAYVRLRL